MTGDLTRFSDAQNEITAEIVRLKKDRRALILAHHFQRPEIQGIADHTGDSLELSRLAARAEEPVIVFCGVHFMAETAAILSPHKTILLPVEEANCSLASALTPEQIRQIKAQDPEAFVIAYINSSAAVKAEAELCCTAANAIRAVRSVAQDRSIVFVPDRHLGHYASHAAGRYVQLGCGECLTHAAVSSADIREGKRMHPGAKVMAHPECRAEVLQEADFIGSTSEIVEHARSQAAGTSFLVATEIGLLDRLKKENPDKSFWPASDYLVCPAMKMTTLEDVRRALRRLQHRIMVDEEIAARARQALNAMLELGAKD